MPRGNRFRHQAYRSERPTSPYRLLQPGSPTNPESAEFSQRLRHAGEQFGAAGVVRIYCVHGTFAGNDALGMFTEMARFAPGLSDYFMRLGRQTVGLVMGELGNFTLQYCNRLENELTAGAGRTIDVRQFNWSSQNNHIGRADGAVGLLVDLARSAEDLFSRLPRDAPPPRIGLWGHSHAGNVFALLTNLLASDESTRDLFFRAARPFYRRWCWRGADLPAWPLAQKLLSDPEHPLRRLKLDIVTLGTPIRYGWDSGGYDNLMHFVNHRPTDGQPEYLACYLDQSPSQLLDAPMGGDYVHQIGIAGTNLYPNPLAVRTLTADLRLHRLLQRGLKHESVQTRVGRGMRVPEEGVTLLVDYRDPGKNLSRNLAGHGVYTRSWWAPFHAEQIAQQFYA